jgi:fumarylacetoacetate (FAA) hydrolase family protein
VADALSTVGFGALIGIMLTYAIEERPRPELVLAAAALCAVLAFSIRQAVHGRA